MNRFFVSVIFVALCALGGCASTANWQHPSGRGGGYDGATMALAECEAYAQGIGPAPHIPSTKMEAPAPTSYTTRGTYSQYGSTGHFQGTTTANGGAASGFASGYNAGSAIADAYLSAKNQGRVKDIGAACMRTRGWIDTSLPEGQAEFKKQSEVKTPSYTKPSEKKSAADEWAVVIKAFLDVEASRQGGIDYRKDPNLLSTLDAYVKALANEPANEDKSMTWFLIEAHKLVLAGNSGKISKLITFQKASTRQSSRSSDSAWG